MRFEILRASDQAEGRQGPDAATAGPPHKKATWNRAENRWEIQVSTMEELFEIMVDTETFILVMLPSRDEHDHGDLPIIELQDTEKP